ncbi:glycoside hydrolase family 3 N-terminal domain-containing protein [Streptomyces fuscigenes]|uniref:glycoside hydrolase family 3 N-terminal domain-containing protein n=1 Tax=Streptomyces fuscigenes TaxID=1528880 RepID=UPI001F1DBE56|nr:glycoside hydrolase family 3 N-terminal domain-containing protein [Streptomyces fuscigenes]MCF3962876.1 beta-N-acetylhexosaminidase [Streptomyces fuscigenes]
MDTPHPSSPTPRRTVLAVAGAAVASWALGAGTARAASSRPEPWGTSAGHGPLPDGLGRLTPRQRAGQRIIYSYPGLTPPDSLLAAIRAGEAAGVIFFGENISGTDQIAAAVAQLVEANESSPVKAPLLLMTDQEGGQVRRLPGAPELSEKQVGQASDPEAAARDAGTGAGQNLAGVGMNVNLSPVLDVFREPGDFSDAHQRSYGTDPDSVGTLGGAFITAQQETGVAATAKHFPGLGAAATSENTDLGPVTLGQSLSELREVDEAPYRAALDAHVKLVMLSWALYPALDPSYPAGLSSKIIQRELRGRLGFTGVTVTDALEAKALSSSYPTQRRAVLAAGAGMDLLLCSARDIAQGQAATDGLVDALADKSLPGSPFDAAVRRVAALRSSLAGVGSTG